MNQNAAFTYLIALWVQTPMQRGNGGYNGNLGSNLYNTNTFCLFSVHLQFSFGYNVPFCQIINHIHRRRHMKFI